MFFEIIIFSISLGFVLGGSHANFKTIRLPYVELAILSVLVQSIMTLGIKYKVDFIIYFSYYLHLTSYFCLFAFMYFFWPYRGSLILTLGLLLNFLVIFLNSGKMPVKSTYLSEEALAVLQNGLDPIHGLLTSDTKLSFLGDIFYISVPWNRQMLSLGDMFLDIGVLIFIVTVMKGVNQLK